MTRIKTVFWLRMGSKPIARRFTKSPIGSRFDNTQRVELGLDPDV